MSKTMMTAAFAALLAASPMALAAQNSDATATAPAGEAITATRIQPGQILAINLKGADVYDQQNQNIATVNDIILDGGSGRVAAVVLDVDGKNVAVPMAALHVAMNSDDKIEKVTIDQSKNQLKSAQAFRLSRSGAGSGGSQPASDDNR